jgi:hypothetical protein
MRFGAMRGEALVAANSPIAYLRRTPNHRAALDFTVRRGVLVYSTRVLGRTVR